MFFRKSLLNGLAVRKFALVRPLRKYSGLPTSNERASIHFVIQDKVGALEDILSLLRKLNISLSRIESRPSKTKGDYDFYVDFVAKPSLVKTALKEIVSKCKQVKVVSAGENDSGSGEVPWFPRKIADLDTFASKVLSYGAELESDHPGFTDAVYRKRRADITEAALSHKHGMALPVVNYTKQEVETWGTVFKKMKDLYHTHACYEHQYIFPLLQQNCGYREDNIPQIAEVSSFLKDCTGWTGMIAVNPSSASYGIAII
jgi:phenylalanine-4-hydroxylase